MTEVIVMEAGRYERNYWLDLWRYRELFRVTAWRDLAVRYGPKLRQTLAAQPLIPPLIDWAMLP
jgi:lipopolysaccharide transport system permease protein